MSGCKEPAGRPRYGRDYPGRPAFTAPHCPIAGTTPEREPAAATATAGIPAARAVTHSPPEYAGRSNDTPDGRPVDAARRPHRRCCASPDPAARSNRGCVIDGEDQKRSCSPRNAHPEATTQEGESGSPWYTLTRSAESPRWREREFTDEHRGHADTLYRGSF